MACFITFHLPTAEVALHTAPHGAKKERNYTIRLFLERAGPGEGRINAISPADKLTAVQLAVRRGWLSTLDRLLDAGGALRDVILPNGNVDLPCNTRIVPFLFQALLWTSKARDTRLSDWLA